MRSYQSVDNVYLFIQQCRRVNRNVAQELYLLTYNFYLNVGSATILQDFQIMFSAISEIFPRIGFKLLLAQGRPQGPLSGRPRNRLLRKYIKTGK